MTSGENVFLLGKSKEETRRRFRTRRLIAASGAVFLVSGAAVAVWAGADSRLLFAAALLALPVVWLVIASEYVVRGKWDRAWKIELLPDTMTLHYVWGADRALPYDNITAVVAAYSSEYGDYDRLALFIATRDDGVVKSGRCGGRGEAVEAMVDAIRRRIREKTGVETGSAESDRAVRLRQKRDAIRGEILGMAFILLRLLLPLPRLLADSGTGRISLLGRAGAAALCLAVVGCAAYLGLLLFGRSLARVRGRNILLRRDELEDDHARGK